MGRSICQETRESSPMPRSQASTIWEQLRRVGAGLTCAVQAPPCTCNARGPTQHRDYDHACTASRPAGLEVICSVAAGLPAAPRLATRLATVAASKVTCLHTGVLPHASHALHSALPGAWHNT